MVNIKSNNTEATQYGSPIKNDKVPNWKRHCSFLFFFAFILSSPAFAVTVSDDFTQATDPNSWITLSQNGYPCLTAGTAANNPGTANTIPGCNYGSPDVVGSGALRLTPASNDTASAIVSNFTFPSNQGLQVTFTTYTYGGNGADGIGFFLQDGSVPTTLPSGGNGDGTVNIGESGGSLGYTCSNYKSTNYNGLTGGYLGLGLDEYGNFLNGGSANDNTASGIGFSSNTIGLRGAGNISWYWLNKTYPSYYPSNLTSAQKQTAVWKTCQTGTLWSNNPAISGQSITGISNSGTTVTVTVPGHGFVNGNTVSLSGTINDIWPTQAITDTAISGTTLTLTVPHHGYVNGNSVVIGGDITAAGGNSDSVAISSVTSTKVNNKYVLIVTTSTSNDFASHDLVTISGNSASGINQQWTIASIVSPTQFKINTGSNHNPCPCGTNGTVTDNTKSTSAPIVTGTHTISGVTTDTFNVTLSSTPTSITNTSGNVTLQNPSPPAISGTYTVSNVTTNTFDISLGSTPGTITNTSGKVSSSAAATNTGTAVQDYAAIPNGYVTLPPAKPLASSSTTRNSATPITYRLQITPSGYLTFMYSYNGAPYSSVLSNWNLTDSNGAMPSTFRFGFSGSTGGLNNIHELTCFQAEPVVSSSSAAANTVQAGQIKTGTQEYLATYNPNNYTASLMSVPVVTTDGTVSVSTVAEWDAACVLTGGACTSMGTDGQGHATHSITVEAPSDRQLLTWNGSADTPTGIPLQWDSLNGTQQAILNSADSQGSIRLGWLRGDRSNEQIATPTPGPLRIRSDLLGDIINSSPTWVGPPSNFYGTAFTDALHGSTGSESSYLTFKTDQATRTNVVYTGSNDGFVHGFRAGSYNADGSYNSATNDGREVIGFMPSSVLASSDVVSLTDPTYSHKYFVDAPPGAGDLYYGGAWHTWLAGTMGEGGAELYALDITDPSQFSEDNASSLVIGDWTASTIACTNADGCGANMGNSTGVPLIRRLHNGQWAIIFGNGLGSSNKVAGIYIGLVNQNTGAITFNWLSTGSGDVDHPNGINNVASADIDGDHVVDYVYAGDLLGNVWRFDLTSDDSANWGVSTYGNVGATPLFTATDGTGPQPITTKIVVTKTVSGGANRILLGFGTGKSTVATMMTPISYAAGTQTVYGIWDWDMSAWNSASSAQVAALTGTHTITRAKLLADSFVSRSGGYITMDKSTVCWKGSSVCNPDTNNTKYGWYLDLTESDEQIIYSPAFSGGEIVFNTTIPPVTTAGQCALALPTGWTIALNMASGGAPDVAHPTHIFPDANGSVVVAPGGHVIVGVRQDAVGTSVTISHGSQTYLTSPNTQGQMTITKFNPQGGVTARRTTWQQLR